MSEELNARNIRALAQALRDMNDRVGDLAGRVSATQAACTELQVRLNAATQELTILRVRSMGRGPTT